MLHELLRKHGANGVRHWLRDQFDFLLEPFHHVLVDKIIAGLEQIFDLCRKVQVVKSLLDKIFVGGPDVKLLIDLLVRSA